MSKNSPIGTSSALASLARVPIGGETMQFSIFDKSPVLNQ